MPHTTDPGVPGWDIAVMGAQMAPHSSVVKFFIIYGVMLFIVCHTGLLMPFRDDYSCRITSKRSRE